MLWVHTNVQVIKTVNAYFEEGLFQVQEQSSSYFKNGTTIGGLI